MCPSLVVYLGTVGNGGAVYRVESAGAGYSGVIWGGEEGFRWG